MTYVITYDISHDGRRIRLARLLAGFGERVQYSVFEATLTPLLFDNMVQQIRDLIRADEDRVLIYPICGSCAERRTALGSAELRPIGGPQVIVI